MKYLLTILMLFCSTQAWATWTKTQEVSASCTDGSGDRACSVTVSALGTGHLIVCMFSNQSSVTGSTMTCNGSGCGTWVAGTGCAVTNTNQGVSSDCAYVLSSTSGSTTITQTYPGSGSIFHRTITCAEMASSVGAAFDVANTVDPEGTFSGGNTTGVALTLTGSNDFIMQQFNGSQTGTTPSAISGAYTSWLDTSQSAQAVATAGAINTAVGTAPTWTTSSTHYTENAIAFKETSVAAAKTTGFDFGF